MAYKSGLWQICLVDGVYNSYKFGGGNLIQTRSNKSHTTRTFDQLAMEMVNHSKGKNKTRCKDCTSWHHDIICIYIYSKISYYICLSTMCIYIYIPMQVHAAASSYAPKAVSLGIWVSLFFCPAGCVGAGRAEMSRVARSVEAGALDDFCRPVS